MSRYIAKFGDLYCDWSTVVDAPVTYLMALEDFKDYVHQEYGAKGLEELASRLERVEQTGTSARDGTTAADLLDFNRAGANEACISNLADMLERYAQPHQ